MFSEPRHTSNLFSMVSFTFAIRRHLIRLEPAPFTSFCLAKSGWVPFADLRVQRLATKRNAEFTEGARNKLTRLWTKVHEILGQCRKRSYFPTLFLPVSFRRYSPFSLKVVEKSNKCKCLLAPNFWGETTPTFLRQIASAIYCPSFGKVWLSSVSWSLSAKPGNEVESRIYVRLVKIWSRHRSRVRVLAGYYCV